MATRADCRHHSGNPQIVTPLDSCLPLISGMPLENGVRFAVASATMGTKKIVLYTVAGLCTLVIGFVLFAYYQFTHNFRIPLSDEQVSDMQTAFKGAMGEAIFNGQQLNAQAVSPEQLKGKNGLDALLTSTPPSNKSQGLIEAYQNDPQKFKRYAEMFDTATNAKQVLDAVIRQGAPHLPRTSEPLAMEARLKVDAWGSPFCIIPAGERLAVVSGGPSRLSCDALPVNPELIEKANRAVFAGPSDVVVVIAKR